MDTMHLLVIDGSEDFRYAMQEMFADRFCVTLASGGTRALELLRSQQFDLLIVNLLLPEIDGLSLLEQAGKEHLPKKILAVTPHISSYVFASARRLDISYVVYLPCCMEALKSRVLDLADANIRPEISATEWCFVSSLLEKLKLPADLHGYPYMLDGILLAGDDSLKAVTKEIYPALARQYGCSEKSVEHSIRNALEQHWPNRDREIWNLYFPGLTQRPSNREFLFRMAQELKQFRRMQF